MTDLTRRAILASSGAVITGALAGCSMSSAEGCQPAEFPQGTATREEPPEPCQYLAALESEGLDTDGTMSDPSGAVSVFYFHNPERHREQIRTVAVTFVPYRRMVGEDRILGFTALETVDNRHGTGYITREWARQRARGDLTEAEYVQKVVDTYGTR